ncbi:uncharacterized protein BX663DRAFT_435012 [Cokeromyces recurvatus]|uniref:uncharacterized protein n=1 Tax=Cokeromyces recurvatus TaxID=90255 RepID=UPI0022200AF4|nr:uncharacterized protein BX663DRAFT_435012 [Cokeromyces recurvatus]KAI7902661.1 hypothetical protein BX663DRAFT_435012 [Cokeromyces recurvatus]
MGSSDLNLKKSWHPATFKNQERVWKEEQKHKEEQAKIEQMRKELAEERQLQELQRMQEEAGTKKRSNKLDWMYASPNANLNGNANNAMEDYLLGKKNVDDLLRAKQKQELVIFFFLIINLIYLFLMCMCVCVCVFVLVFFSNTYRKLLQLRNKVDLHFPTRMRIQKEIFKPRFVKILY